MTSTLLNIAGRIEPQLVAVLETISRVTAELSMTYVIVGATARDWVLHLGYEAPLRSVTKDLDLAIEVPDWTAFHALKSRLFQEGFTPSREEHSLLSPEKIKIDILPFGQLEDEASSIAWPPKGDVVMNMLGFREACEQAVSVRIKEAPDLDIPVVRPDGMVLLKLISWTDRAREDRHKDAMDIAYLLTSYEQIPSIQTAFYENEGIMEKYESDQTLGCAHLLGEHASSIASEGTHRMILRLANGELGRLNFDRLAEEMCQYVDLEYARHQQLLTAFIAGFNQTEDKT